MKAVTSYKPTNAKSAAPKAPAPAVKATPAPKIGTAQTIASPKAKTTKSSGRTSKTTKTSARPPKVPGATRILPGPRSARGRGIPRPAPMAGFDDSGKSITVTFSKSEQIVRLLREKPGLSIAQLMQLTGWQAHSVRGFFSGIIRKKYGLTLNVHLRDGVRHYQIVK